MRVKNQANKSACAASKRAISQTTLTPKVVALAHDLAVYETVAASGSEATTPGAICAIRKLGPTIRTLASTAGFRSLLSRALILAQTQFPDLSAMKVEPDGSLKGCNDNGHQEHADGTELVLAQLLGLLVTFIGESLMLSLVVTGWPDLPLSTAKTRRKGNHGTAKKSND